MNSTQETFEKFSKRKPHESDNLSSRKGWKKRSYSAMRGIQRALKRMGIE